VQPRGDDGDGLVYSDILCEAGLRVVEWVLLFVNGVILGVLYNWWVGSHGRAYIVSTTISY